MNRPEISVVIPSFNEERVIGRCLESMAQTDFARDRYEVILVDNGSKDRTLQIADAYAGRVNLQVIVKTGVRISGLRNLGAKTARGDVLAFLDADCLAPKDWLVRITSLGMTAGSGIAGAHYLLPPGSTWVGRTWHHYQEASKTGEVSHVPAGDLVMRREDFHRIGGFDESIQTNEDYELCERVRKAGMPVRAIPQIGVVHLGTAQNLGGFYRKQLWHGSHVLKVFLRDALHSHNRNAVLFAVFTLGCAALVCAGSVWALFGGPRVLPLSALLALLLPPAALSLRRVTTAGSWRDFLPLSTLYLVYGVARARALLNVKNLS
jgi:glycosyltransferase involved in cell wall biosynthesis